MKLVNLFKGLFKDKKLKKEKQESRQLPKGKKSGGKGVRIFVWALILFVAITGPLGFVRANNALDKSKQANAEAGDSETKEGNIEHQAAYNSPRFKIYANHVVNDYVNIPKQDKKRDQYMEDLQGYLVSEDFLPHIDFDGKRELLNKTYYGQRQQGDHMVAQYKVSYNTFVKGDDDPHHHNAMLNIPIRYDNGGYAVVESIYLTAVSSLKNNNQDKVESPYAENSDNKLSADIRHKLKDWIQDFFADYASENQEDMAYMMDDPEALDGMQEFQAIEDFSAYKKDDRYIVKTKVRFKEPNSGISHEEPFTLTVKTMNEKYYVKNMKQTIGG